MDNNLVGQTIQGRYYVVKQLGRGGLGVTFLACDRQCFDSPCVVKQLKPKTTNSQTLAIARRLFNREAEIMNRLGHCDRIPRLLAYFEHDNEFFLVQELIEGHDLSQEIIAGRPWSESKTIDLLEDVLEVLLIVQQYNVIHRDLKPSNLMRRRQDNQIILIDFGSVKQVSTQIIDPAGQIKQTVAVGTKSYMPMEQTIGRPGFYSDIYALGVIAIQALTGIDPRKLAIDNRGEIVWRNRLDRSVNYQPRLLNILDKMVRYRYRERFASAGIVLSELKQLDAARNNAKTTAIVPPHQVAPRRPTQPHPVADTNREITTVISQPAPTKEPAAEQNAMPLYHKGTMSEDVSLRTASFPKGLLKDTETDRESLASHIASRPAIATDAVKLARSREKALSVQRVKKSKSGKFTAAIAILALLTASLGGWLLLEPEMEEPEIELSLYQNSTLGFQVNYPKVWLTQNRDDFFAEGVLFLSPLDDDPDRFQERVSILIENLADDTSLAEYTEQSMIEIKRLSVPDVSEAWSADLGGIPARQIVYSGEENGTSLRRMQTWTIVNDRAYVVTYTALPESYDIYLPIVEEMVKSFEIVE